ncbi:MAG: LuxR C-terminal-related transcriptional regulator [Lachnoclostridium sp.]|nr:LuxR C-terminal-related transcriptional regulator [Lachnoclostridium sp.]
MKRITIAIASYSPILTTGLATILRGYPDCSVTVVDTTPETLDNVMAERMPSLLFADTSSVTPETLRQLKESSDHKLKTIAVVTGLTPYDPAQTCDDRISFFDSPTRILDTLRRNIASDDDDDKLKDLSPREKEVIIGVVKGLSNKEIADKLNVSVNTVMTHRRNIASKLQIHSPAGLTIYAIVSGLINLDEIKP